MHVDVSEQMRFRCSTNQTFSPCENKIKLSSARDLVCVFEPQNGAQELLRFTINHTREKICCLRLKMQKAAQFHSMIPPFILGFLTSIWRLANKVSFVAALVVKEFRRLKACLSSSTAFSLARFLTNEVLGLK